MKFKKLIMLSIFLISIQLFSQSSYKFSNSYKIKIPSSMQVMSLSEEASLQYGNIYKEIYCVVIDESKSEFIDIFKELGIYNNYDSPLNNYRKVQVEFMKESGLIITTIGDVAIFNAGGKTGQLLEITGSVDGIGVFYVVGFIQGTSKLYMITAWTLKDRKYKYRNDLIEIVKSFREY